LDQRGAPEDETIGELFQRLIDDGRSLVTAELALFRLDFYQRIGRAKVGIILCLIGVIMGQAAAVVMLISIAYALTPWLGGFGGAAIAAVVGGIAAVLLLRFGAKRLMLIVDDNPTEKTRTTATMDELFDRARVNSQEARAQLANVVSDTQHRLNPHTLALELWEEVVNKGQLFAHEAVDALRKRPFRIAAIAVAAILVIVRPPFGKIAGLLSDRLGETGSESKSLKGKGARRRARPPMNEEKTS